MGAWRLRIQASTTVAITNANIATSPTTHAHVAAASAYGVHPDGKKVFLTTEGKLVCPACSADGSPVASEKGLGVTHAIELSR